jgi:hypothetical protein
VPLGTLSGAGAPPAGCTALAKPSLPASVLSTSRTSE